MAFYNARFEREEFRKNLWEGTSIIEVDKRPFLRKPIYDHTDTLVWTYIIKKLTSYSVEDGYIIISKQPYGDEILSVHNEFCSNGAWHPEWRYMTNSYYRTHPSSLSPLLRIVGFYMDNPTCLIANLQGKFKRATYQFSSIYYLSIVLLGLISITSQGRHLFRFGSSVVLLLAHFLLPFQYDIFLVLFMFLVYNISFFLLNRSSDIPWMIPCILTNVTIITLLLIGEPRYVQAIEPIIMLGVFYLAIKLVKQWIPAGK